MFYLSWLWFSCLIAFSEFKNLMQVIHNIKFFHVMIGRFKLSCKRQVMPCLHVTSVFPNESFVGYIRSNQHTIFHVLNFSGCKNCRISNPHMALRAISRSLLIYDLHQGHRTKYDSHRFGIDSINTFY